MSAPTTTGRWSRHQFRLLNLLLDPTSHTRTIKDLTADCSLDRSEVIELADANLILAWRNTHADPVDIRNATVAGVAALTHLYLRPKGKTLVDSPDTWDRMLRTLADAPAQWVKMFDITRDAGCHCGIALELHQAGLVEIVVRDGEAPLDKTSKLGDIKRNGTIDRMKVRITAGGRFRAGR